MMVNRGILFIVGSLICLVLYQNCAEKLNQDSPTEVPGQFDNDPGQTVAKPLPGAVDTTEPINIAPSPDGNPDGGSLLQLSNGQVINDGSPYQGQCLRSELLSDLNQFLEQAQICQDKTSVPEGSEVFCTMEYNAPWIELGVTGQNNRVGLGKGNACPRSPTYLCKNNEALQALIGNIGADDFGPCP